jgi:hypothetical protein
MSVVIRQPNDDPPPRGWWESWSIAAVAILVAVVAVAIVVIAVLVAPGLSDG